MVTSASREETAMCKYREHLLVSIEGGRKSVQKVIIDEREARRLTRGNLAVVVSMDEGVYHDVYRGGEKFTERIDGLYIGRHAEFDMHLGWTS